MDTQGTVPSNIVINGQEYSPDEAQELIDTGRKTHEYESKWNVELDKVWPKYGVSTNYKTVEQERNQARQELEDFKLKQQQQVETPADIQSAREAARKIGIVLDEDVKGKYVGKDELETWYTDRRAKEKADETAVKSVLEEADKIAEEVKKSGSPVRFNKKAVLAYASAYGKTDLREAYEEMNSDELIPWKEQQLASKKAGSLKTLGMSGKKNPEEVRMTNDNVRDALHEALTQG
jgi:hypothetical protein